MFAINIVRSSRVWNKLNHLTQIEIGMEAHYGVGEKKLIAPRNDAPKPITLATGIPQKNYKKPAREKPFERFWKDFICKSVHSCTLAHSTWWIKLKLLNCAFNFNLLPLSSWNPESLWWKTRCEWLCTWKFYLSQRIIDESALFEARFRRVHNRR